MKILGIDEAGRGCVLGDLFVGAYCCTESQLKEIQEAGATDSKKLSAKKRTTILSALENIGTGSVVQISPQQIDSGNINTLEEEAFATLIVKYKPQKVYIDAPAHPRAIPAFQKRLTARIISAGVKVPDMVIEPKADLTYPIVGAASIFAKVKRDLSIHALGEVGSGYPSDPKTRKWIKGFLIRKEELPKCVRKRWGTIEKLKQEVQNEASRS